MFENLLTNLKTQTNKVSTSFNENLRSQTTKLSENFDNFKYKLKTNKVSNFLTKHNNVNEFDEQLNNDYFSPRAFSTKTVHCEENDLMWPILNENNENIIKVIPFDEDPENLDIVERFIKVITINDNDANEIVRVNYFGENLFRINLNILFCLETNRSRGDSTEIGYGIRIR